MEIELFNCNSIDHGLVSIERNMLNIKYGINGTGKSSFARALEYASDQAKLDQLTPYKYLGEDPITEEHRPKVICPEEMKRVAIFNDTYVDQYLFQADEVMPNSFEILIKTADYDKKMEDIQRELEAVQKIFRDNPKLSELISNLASFRDSYGRNMRGISTSSSLSKGIGQGNKIENIPQELTAYTPFIQSENRGKWLTWLLEGKDHLANGHLCPYCATQLSDDTQKTIEQVKVVYNAKYVAELQKTLNKFNVMQDYFSDNVNENLKEIAANEGQLNPLQTNFLTQLREQVEGLLNQLIEIQNLHYGTLKDVAKIEEKLLNAKPTLQYFVYLNTPNTRALVQPLEAAIDQVLASANQLKKDIGIQKSNVRKTIAQHTKNINGFLMRAGYKYQVAIESKTSDEDYKLVLRSIDSDAVITNVKAHLSYGERNAFALMLFMYQMLRENPDLIIMDDPISSFDQNKKYAIMDMLFQESGTFRGKTVIMLTHDFEPVLDVVHTFESRYGGRTKAAFLYNQNGELKEKRIEKSDIMSFLKIADNHIGSNLNEISKMIYLRRKMEVLGAKNLGWELLSNVFHNRSKPTFNPDKDDKKENTDEETADATKPETTGEETKKPSIREMTDKEIAEATEMIQASIPGFEYKRIIDRIRNFPEMKDLYHQMTSNYEKLQLFRTILMSLYGDENEEKTEQQMKLSRQVDTIYKRDYVFKKFIDSAYHIESDTMFQLDPAEYPTIPDYIIALCDKHLQDLEVAVGKLHTK